MLTFSTPYSDSDVATEQDEIASIESSRQFLVETVRGQRLSGSLVPGPAQAATVIVGETIALAEISIIQPAAPARSRHSCLAA